MPTNQIEPILSSWRQILSAPGIYVVGRSGEKYRVAVDPSYIPWLSSHGFIFQYINNAVDSEEPVQGKCAAAWNADARFVEDAVRAISLGCPQGLELTYRNSALGRQQLRIEWEILWRDLVNTSLFSFLEKH